jgi:hypothetical protein
MVQHIILAITPNQQLQSHQISSRNHFIIANMLIYIVAIGLFFFVVTDQWYELQFGFFIGDQPKHS